MQYQLDGQDQDIETWFQCLLADEQVMVVEESLDTDKAEILIDKLEIIQKPNQLVLPQLMIHIKGYVVAYDDVELIDQDGIIGAERFNNRDSLKRINAYYQCDRNEYRWLIDGGAYTDKTFETRLQATVRHKTFTMPLKLIRYQIQDDDITTVIDVQQTQYDLCKNDYTSFSKLLVDLMRQMMHGDESGDLPVEMQIEDRDRQNDKPDTSDTVSFDQEQNTDVSQTDQSDANALDVNPNDSVTF